MDEIWGPVVVTLGVTALVIIPIVVNKIIKFKLDIAKINAETTLKAEEIRAKNQLEIEMLLRQDGQVRKGIYREDEEYSESLTGLKDVFDK